MKVFNYHEVTGQPVEGKPWVTMRKVIGEADGAPNFIMRVFELTPGQTEVHLEEHWQEHEVYVISGQGLVRTGRDDISVRPGDVIYIAPWEKHQVVNAGEEPFRFVCVIPNDAKAPVRMPR